MQHAMKQVNMYHFMNNSWENHFMHNSRENHLWNFSMCEKLCWSVSDGIVKASSCSSCPFYTSNRKPVRHGIMQQNSLSVYFLVGWDLGVYPSQSNSMHAVHCWLKVGWDLVGVSRWSKSRKPCLVPQCLVVFLSIAQISSNCPLVRVKLLPMGPASCRYVGMA